MPANAADDPPLQIICQVIGSSKVICKVICQARLLARRWRKVLEAWRPLDQTKWKQLDHPAPTADSAATADKRKPAKEAPTAKGWVFKRSLPKRNTPEELVTWFNRVGRDKRPAYYCTKTIPDAEEAEYNLRGAETAL